MQPDLQVNTFSSHSGWIVSGGQGEVAFGDLFWFSLFFIFFRIGIRDAVLHRVRRARADVKADEKMI